MRTLDSALTTSQQAATATPYVKVTFTKRDGSVTRTYATDDGTNKIVTVQQAEGRWNGHIQLVGSSEFSMLIRIRDADNSIAALDHKGYRCDIDWGFNTASGNKSSRGPWGYVINQRTVSVAGDVFVEFTCLSQWDIFTNSMINVATASVRSFDGTRTIRHELMDLIGGDADAYLADDGGVFTDELTDATDDGADDVTLLPVTPAVNDAFYIGDAAQFNRVSTDLTTVGVGTWTTVLEYWNGSVWFGLTDLAGNSSFTTGIYAFKTGQLQIIAFLTPSDWATTTVNGQGPFYYIRVRVSAFTSITTQPLATKITIGTELGVALDTSDGAQGDDFLPKFSTDYQDTFINIIRSLVEYTLLGVVIREDGFHLIYIDNAQVSADYTYDTTHDSYMSERSQGLIIPNKIVIVDIDPAQGDNTYSGSSENTASSSQIGVITTVITDASVTSDAIATTLADRAIKRLLRDVQQGSVTAPMNCGQEVWDLVAVTDARMGVTFEGRTSLIVREYVPAENRYTITIQMGGVASVSRADYLNRFIAISEGERTALANEENIRAEIGLPPIDRATVDDIVDAKLEAMGFGPLIVLPSDPTASEETVPVGGFLDLGAVSSPITSLNEEQMRALGPDIPRPTGAQAVDAGRELRDILNTQGASFSLADAMSFIINSFSSALEQRLSQPVSNVIFRTPQDIALTPLPNILTPPQGLPPLRSVSNITPQSRELLRTLRRQGVSDIQETIPGLR